MRNLRIKIEYDGTDYCGWQVQNRTQDKGQRTKSVQGTIEKTLQKILQEKIKVIGSGRTDAGVHALAQVANFRTRSDIPAIKLQRALNGILPEDIKVTAVKEARADFHSRFQAKSKVYRYTILNRPCHSPLLRNQVYFYPYSLDVKLMRKESRVLLGRHDFSSFRASGSRAKYAVRTIKRIVIKKINNELSTMNYQPKVCPLITIYIEADGFLYNMVRNIVGTLVKIGRAKLPKGSLRKILSARNRKLAGPTAPAKGLCLVKVKY